MSLAALLAILGGLLPGVAASAQGEAGRLRNVVLSIFPEYDDPLGIGSPALLVMLDGQFTGTVPGTIRFLVPSTARMYSAGSGPRSQYQGGPHTRQPSDIPGWDEVSYELKTDIFVLEYYVPIGTTPAKDFSADFIPQYPVEGLQVVVLEPRQATDFAVLPQTQPATEQPSVDSEGFNLVRYSYPSLNAEQPLTFNFTYTKSNPAPSLEIRDSSFTTGMVIVIVVVAAAVIGLGLFWVITRKPPDRRRRARVPVRPSQGGKSPGDARFCPGCGARVDKADRFCPKCGARQRPGG